MTTDLPPHTRWLSTFEDRCSKGFHEVHHPDFCSCDELAAALRAKAQGQALATDAHPDEASRVDAAIRQLAATGEPFSANDARRLHGVTGGVVGARFTAMHKAGVIRIAKDEENVSEPSTAKSTHGHPIARWRGVA